MNTLRPLSAAVALLFFYAASLSAATTLYFNSTADPNPGWDASNAWSLSDDPAVFDQAWQPGSIADFGAGGVRFDTEGADPTIGTTEIDIGGMINSGSQVNFVGFGQGKIRLNIVNNGILSGDFRMEHTALHGSFELVAGTITGASGAVTDPNPRTVTVSGTGHIILYITSRSLIGNANTDLVLRDNGQFDADRWTNNTNLGTVTILDQARFNFGNRLGIPEDDLQTTIRGLSGDATAEFITMAFSDGNPDRTGTKNVLRIEQDHNTTYAGLIHGTGIKTNGPGYNTTQIVKAGTGDLTLSGDILEMQETTIVEAGRLFINGTTTDFGADDNSSVAILVQDGAALGGTGVIQTANGKSVVVEEGGSLVAGLDGTAGTTTFTLGTGASLDLSDAAGNAGWLIFDLGSSSAAGTTYDHISVTAGEVIIGNGLLGFADFEFSVLDGFGAGIFTLLSADTITGSLADSSLLSGQIDGWDASLSLVGNDLILTVIPEPGVVSLLAGGIALCYLIRRRRSGTNC